MTDSLGAMRRLSELMRRVNLSADTDSVLEEVVHGVVDVLGYGVAAIARVEGDMLVMTHVAGPADVMKQILGRRTPAEQVLDEFRQADQWGILRFVPAGRMSEERRRAAWIPEIDVEPDADDDAWHPEHALYAPLYSATGELLGSMAVDLPPGNRVPSQVDRELLEMFVVQAGLALSHARDRERLTEQVRMDAMVKEVARAGSKGTLAEILQASMVAVAEGLAPARRTCVACTTRGRRPSTAPAPAPAPGEPGHPTLREDLAAEHIGSEPQEVRPRDSSPALPRSHENLRSLMRWLEADRVVVCPVAAREELLGYAVLAFSASRPPLTPGERQGIAEVSRELGRIVHQARVLETEQRLVQELRELARYRSELIATISHELKTPLTAILGHAELVQERFPTLSSIDAITRNAHRLNRLVANLLHYSRVQGLRDTVRRAVDLVEMCEASVNLLAIRASQKGVDLRFDDPGQPVVVFGDAEELGRVIDNLVDNSVKYTHEGGEVTVSMATTSEAVVVTVTDTGIGMSEADLPNVFSAFHRSTNPNALSIPGTGLGLPIAQRIAQAHGGRIDGESKLGVGSTFHFTLPLRSG
jgi:signal transduction histidine kinase